MRIEDGLGDGRFAGVDGENRLLVLSTTQPDDKHVNIVDGKQWLISFDGVSAAGAGDYIFYLKNTGTETYGISDIRALSDAVTRIDIDVVSDAPVYTSATDCAIVNRNTGSSRQPSVTAKSDTDITGLSDDGLLFFMQLEANKFHKLTTTSNIILTPGQAIAIKNVGGVGAITCVVSLTNISV